MRRLLNNPRIAAILALSAALLIGWRFWPDRSQALGAPPSPAAPEDAGVPAAAQSAADAPPASSPVAALLAELPAAPPARDPFAARPGDRPPGPRAPEAVDTLHLSALWTEHDSTLALINGEIRQLGDIIGRLRIAAATQEGVWVTHGAARDFIALGGDFTLRTSVPPGVLPVPPN